MKTLLTKVNERLLRLCLGRIAPAAAFVDAKTWLMLKLKYLLRQVRRNDWQHFTF